METDMTRAKVNAFFKTMIMMMMTMTHGPRGFLSDHAVKYAKEYVSFLNSVTDAELTDMDTLEQYIDEICEIVFED